MRTMLGFGAANVGDPKAARTARTISKRRMTAPPTARGCRSGYGFSRQRGGGSDQPAELSGRGVEVGRNERVLLKEPFVRQHLIYAVHVIRGEIPEQEMPSGTKHIEVGGPG